MSLKAIRLRNFRGFRDAELNLKKLTVLLGPNSSGKSSFGHALAAMAHAHRIYRFTPQATLTPSQDDARNWPVDLGGLSDLRTIGTKGPVAIELSTDAGVIKLGFGLDNYNSLVPSYFSIPDFQEAPDAKRGKAEATRFQIKHPREPIKGDTTYFAPSEGVSTVIKEPGTELRRLNENQWEESGVPSVVVLEGLLPKGFTHESGTSRPVNPAILKEVGFLFDNVTYLRASRRRPFRSYPKELGQPQRIGYGGEWTATILQEKNNVIYADLPALPRPQRVKPKVRYEYSTKQSTLTGAVKAWLKHLGIARSVKSSKSENDRERLKLTVALTGQEPHNLTEVGFGISQVLPVLAAGLLQEEGSLFVVDLPEAHLHPKPQAELADFFCALALSGRHSLVETHSEMFFHRLRLRAEMIPELKKHIAVYFLDAASENLCCAPRPVGLELDSETDWPAGFFQEGWEMEVQLGMLRRARKH